MPAARARLSRIATLFCSSAAILLGCAQLLGLQEDVPGGPCEIDADCAPHQVCVAKTCSSTDAGSSGKANGGNGAMQPGDGGAAHGGNAANAGSGANGGSETSAGNRTTGGSETGGAGDTNGGTGSVPECSDPGDCTGADNECSQRTCVDGVCGVDYEDEGFVVGTQTAGDCRKAVCDGSGLVIFEVDDADLPENGNVCIIDSCEQGEPAHDFAPTTTNCGASSQFKCDGQGLCGGCTQSSDCGLNTLCATYTCTGNTCNNNFVPSGQGNLANTAGDCKKNVCDGMGSPTAIADGSDLPNDNNPCTKDLCMSGAPSNPPESATKSCGTFSKCNGAGTCVCTDPASAACPRVGAQCGTITNGCGEQIACPNICSGVDVCGGAGNPNGCGCTPQQLNCGFGQCAGTLVGNCGQTEDCSADCESICPDNCAIRQCVINQSGTGACDCLSCQG